MKYIDEYRDSELVMKLAKTIERNAIHEYAFMEVCGGHTAAIHRFGLPSLLPENIRLLSGPGCPVCVTSTEFIDRAVAYAGKENIIIATFGDMIRVPGSTSSLEKEKSAGADIRVVLSAAEAHEIAKINPGRTVIFLGIGFETTAPGTAVSIRSANREKTSNYLVLSAHKVMPPAMEAILTGDARLDGFICPGHVATITGSRIFDFIPERFRLACVVSGFEPVDLLLSILMLLRQVNRKIPSVEIQYTRAVTREGNLSARENMDEVFESCDSVWRGLGTIRGGGLRLREKYEMFDAEKRIPLKTDHADDDPRCRCGEILKGMITPEKCSLFAVKCSPGNPVGACMVSPEGSCNTWFRYKMMS